MDHPDEAMGQAPKRHLARSLVRRRRRLRRALLTAGATVALAVVGVVASRGARNPSAGTPGTTARRAPAQSVAAAAAAASSAGTPLDPARFLPGACVAFPPTRGNRRLTVFIDAGHGGRDPGAVGATASGQSVEEARLTLPVELDAAALLRAVGFRVVVSRTRTTAVARIGPGDMSGGIYTVHGADHEIAARDVCANLARASLLVGIYFDAGGSPANAGSVTGYDRDRPFWRANLRFANLLQRDVLAAMNARGWQVPNDGVQLDVFLGGPALSAAGARYDHLMLLGPAMAGYFTTPSRMPGALIEPLFVTDPFEAAIASSATGQRTIARGVAQAVEQYFAR